MDSIAFLNCECCKERKLSSSGKWQKREFALVVADIVCTSLASRVKMYVHTHNSKQFITTWKTGLELILCSIFSQESKVFCGSQSTFTILPALLPEGLHGKSLDNYIDDLIEQALHPLSDNKWEQLTTNWSPLWGVSSSKLSSALSLASFTALTAPAASVAPPPMPPRRNWTWEILREREVDDQRQSMRKGLPGMPSIYVKDGLCFDGKPDDLYPS